MSEALAKQFRAFTTKVLHDMNQLTTKSDPKEVSRVNGSWKRLRSEVAKAATIPGEARTWQASIWATPEFKSFQKVRTHMRHSTEEERARKREYAKAFYLKCGKARRASPEVRAKLNEQRRKRYQAQKEARMQRTPEEVSVSDSTA